MREREVKGSQQMLQMSSMSRDREVVCRVLVKGVVGVVEDEEAVGGRAAVQVRCELDAVVGGLVGSR